MKRLLAVVLALSPTTTLANNMTYSECYLDGLKSINDAKLHSLVEKACESISNPDPLPPKLSQAEFKQLKASASKVGGNGSEEESMASARIYNGNPYTEVYALEFEVKYRVPNYGSDKNKKYVDNISIAKYRINRILKPLSYQEFKFDTKETNMTRIIHIDDIILTSAYGKQVEH